VLDPLKIVLLPVGKNHHHDNHNHGTGSV